MANPNDIASASVSINVQGLSGEIAGSNNDKTVVLLEKILAELKSNKQESAKGTKELKGVLSAGNFSKSLSNALKMTGLVGMAAGAVSTGIAAGAGITAATNYNVPNQGYGYDKVMYEGEEKVAKINEKTGEIMLLLDQRQATELGILDDNGAIKANLRVQSDKYSSMTRGLERKEGVLQTQDADILLISSELQKQVLVERKITKTNEEILKKKQEQLRKLGGTADYSGLTSFREDTTGANMSTPAGPVNSNISYWERLAATTGPVQGPAPPPFDIAAYSTTMTMIDKFNELQKSPNPIDKLMSVPVLIQLGLR